MADKVRVMLPEPECGWVEAAEVLDEFTPPAWLCRYQVLHVKFPDGRRCIAERTEIGGVTRVRYVARALPIVRI